MTLEPLGLHVQVTKPDGRSFRWDGGYRAQDTPTNLSFGSKRQTGFDTMSVTLPRQLDIDFADLELFDDIAVKAASGDSRWEGRVVQINRSSGPDGDTIQIDAVGWMAHMQDQKQPMLYVDQDLSRWGPPSATRRTTLMANYGPFDASTIPDSTGQPALKTALTGAWTAAPGLGISEALFDAGHGLQIGSLYYAWSKGANVNNADANYTWQAFLATDDAIASTDNSGQLRAAGPGTGTLTATATRQCAMVYVLHAAAGGTANVEYPILWTCLAVYGTHGLTKRGTATATLGQGLYASDVLKHMVGAYCPRLNTAGVQDTSLPLPHLSWPEPATVYDAALKLNGFHLWELAVWEDHTVHWSALDLTGWDWEVRTDDPGVEVDLQGDSAGDLVNSAIVHYDKLPGRNRTTLYPSDSALLRDDSIDHPLNRHGIGYRPVEITPSFPMDQDTAIEVGRIGLAEAQQARRPGTITVGSGYIRDRQGNLRPSSAVRSGDRIRITNIPGDVIRPLGEARYDDDSRKLTMGVDSSLERLEGFYNRVQVSLEARGLAA